MAHWTSYSRPSEFADFSSTEGISFAGISMAYGQSFQAEPFASDHTLTMWYSEFKETVC